MSATASVTSLFCHALAQRQLQANKNDASTFCFRDVFFEDLLKIVPLGWECEVEVVAAHMQAVRALVGGPYKPVHQIVK